MPTTIDFAPSVVSINTTIANGQTTSGAVDLSGTTLVGIQMPAAFTGTSLTFQAATSLGGTYQTIIDGAGSNLSKTVAQGKFLMLTPSQFAGVRFLKIVSGSSEGADRTLELVTRPI